MMAKRALVVDDSPYIQKELSKILEKHGCQVVATAACPPQSRIPI